MKIFKYKISMVTEQTLSLPYGFKMLDIQLQNGMLQMWAMVDEEAEQIDVDFYILGTGDDCDSMRSKLHVKTFQNFSMVWHVFRDKTNAELLKEIAEG